MGDLLRDIETALDTVLDEREKQLQQQAGQQGQNSTAGAPALVAIPGTESLRSPFSRAQTSQYEGKHRKHIRHIDFKKNNNYTSSQYIY